MKSKMKQILSGAVVAASLLLTGVAYATPYSFTVTGDYAASWIMDSQPEPDFLTWPWSFGLKMVGHYDYQPDNKAVIVFGSGSGRSLQIFGSVKGEPIELLVADGPTLYTGTDGEPVFTPGTYALTGYRYLREPGNFTLTISPVPEAETYAMVIAGVGVVGVVARRRKKRA
ncbi:conserved hypothetical protein [Ricinus communis]|uniref:Ice-binding protein C-terminal domain-containing protein n=1 Tax=Ricinus communis TaxID=3988 RepID=B9TCB4_RICCO|nr:conserved hypothetical protein [Ricinus communis]